jgi:uncharacterized membrane protein YkvA (DUF1232 family)
VIVLQILLGVLATIALSWALLVVFLLVARPYGMGVKEAGRFAPDVARLVRALGADDTLPSAVRRRLGIVAIYLALPIDVIPDFIPLLGYADDMIVLAWGLRSAVRHAGPAALDRHWRGSPEGLAVVRRLTGVRPDDSPATS